MTKKTEKATVGNLAICTVKGHDWQGKVTINALSWRVIAYRAGGKGLQLHCVRRCRRCGVKDTQSFQHAVRRGRKEFRVFMESAAEHETHVRPMPAHPC